MSPVVSVVIPCFNLGTYLHEAVQSVLEQTYRDFEIVIVDDGSDDPVTQHVLNAYTRPRSKIVRIANRGVAGARNVGIEKSSGRYISFLDADDSFEPRFLERTVARLEEDDSLAFASCWLRAFGAKTFEWEPVRCDFPWLLAEDTVCTAAPTRREALLHIGGFDEDHRIDGWEDWDLAIGLVSGGFEGTIVPEHLFRYRQRPRSKSKLRSEAANYARVFEYLLDKYADAYERHAAGVAHAILERAGELERLWGDDSPSHPAFDPDSWRQSLIELEQHRKRLEDGLAGEDEDLGPLEAVRWGQFRRVEPVSRFWGVERGQPVDRYYIEGFLRANVDDIVGDVLEINDPGYIRMFAEGVRSATVLDINEHNEEATLIADLGEPDSVPEAALDCAIVTQTLQFLLDLEQAIRNLWRSLVPGGVLLVTVPCVSRIDPETGVDGDFWRFTAASARNVFERVFGEGRVEVQSFGNVLSCTAFLQGLAIRDLTVGELDQHDRYFPLIIGVRAVKGSDVPAPPRRRAVQGHLDGATCRRITGWARDAAAPHQRLRVELLADGKPIGDIWGDSLRPDLAEAGIGGGRLGFHHQPGVDLHGDPPPEISARIARGGPELRGSTRPAECICSGAAILAPGLAGFSLDRPAGERVDRRESPLEVMGWALGGEGPVEAIELLDGDQPFRTVPLSRARPDIAEAYPAVPWAGTSGFAACVSLLGTGAGLDLEIRALLPDGKHAALGIVTVPPADAGDARITIALDAAHTDVERLGPALRQDLPGERVVVRGATRPSAHPRFESVEGWADALDEPDALVWVAHGVEGVTPAFLSAAAAALSGDPSTAFAVASSPPPPDADAIVRALSGRAAGSGVLFRAAAANVLGGLDESAPTPAAAVWDLTIRFAEAGQTGAAVDVVDEHRPTVAELAAEDGIRWVHRKHAALYSGRVREVLLGREETVGRLLRENHLRQRRHERTARPALRAVRRERDRLTAKLRRARTAGGEAVSDEFWGDFRRLEPLGSGYGEQRGLPIDRHYIERFLDDHRNAAKGRVLTFRDGVDVTNLLSMSDGTCDCVLLEHGLRSAPDPRRTLIECRRVLKVGGTLLVAEPVAARVDPEAGPDGDRWRFSERGLRLLVAEVFPDDEVALASRGNRAGTLGFLVGLAADELPPGTLDRDERAFPLVVTAHVTKRERVQE